ncbi:hypothetical protein EXN66_Car006036 [Channa argus]|uniref:Uncharacterized protein n=1 Tax=Channa argus TaxID=215402 RepID=A0A6G1PJJ4_CHAAH|nr:hypothetical protein EXN66_Car006036 [Channa argus]
MSKSNMSRVCSEILKETSAGRGRAQNSEGRDFKLTVLANSEAESSDVRIDCETQLAGDLLIPPLCSASSLDAWWLHVAHRLSTEEVSKEA